MKKLISLLTAVVLCLCLCTGGASALWSAETWEKSYYLDPFGDATEDYYLGMTKRASGSYKSGSVTDGALEAELRVDENRVCILLYENGDEQVRNTLHGSIGFSVLMKAADGTKTQLDGTMASGGDCVEIWEDQAQSILHFPDRTPQENPVAAALCAEDGEVSFYLTREDQPATSYLFTVRTGNFAALYEAEIVTPIREAAYTIEEMASVDMIEPSWFDDALFVGGDVCSTLSYYAERSNGGLGDALFLTRTSFTLSSAVNGTMELAYRGDWYSIPNAVKASGCSKVFLVLGIEDIGRMEDEAYKMLWSDLITAIQEANPDVRIIVESITPVASGHDNSRINNTNINAYNDYLKNYCLHSDCNYVDVNTGMKDENGNLDSKLCRDGYYLFSIDAGETWAGLLCNPDNYAFDPRG